jgi:peroxiredoxin Q/BCP
LAQLRQDYDEFVARDAEVLVIGPDGPRAFQRTWQQESFPFPGLADPQHRVAEAYNQEVNLLKLGRMPLIVVDSADRFLRALWRIYERYAQSSSAGAGRTQSRAVAVAARTTMIYVGNSGWIS